MDSLPARALAFATQAHGAIDQRRRYVDTPYIEHPVAVAAIVATVPGHTPEMLAAAYLHDVVEDTPVTLAQIREAFGEVVASLVDELTDAATPAEGDRASRKARACARLADASADAQTVKLADLIHNTATIVEHDRKFARLYLREKAQLLAVLTKGDPGLLQQAQAQLERSLHEVGVALS